MGQPLANREKRTLSAVYPHVCGAALRLSDEARYGEGLSPRVWGSPTPSLEQTTWIGSIPTCVGQPQWQQRQLPQPSVYPHVCGAAQAWIHGTGTARGLSPRVWGSLPAHMLLSFLCGSIPTCVGQPNLNIRKGTTRTVYPHVCGAAAGLPLVHGLDDGLSPRVWGSRPGALLWGKSTRSIPTCVGQPLRHPVPGTMDEVYPHVCGAAGCPRRMRTVGMGLSPRVWGSLAILQTRIRVLRSIPTCVGQP